MSHLLFCATPVPGHVNPLLSIASSLKSRGHEITFLTSDIFRPKIEAAGFGFAAFEGKADIDYRNLEDRFPQRLSVPPGVERFTYDLQYIFIEPIPDQYRAIEAVSKRSSVDLILTDSFFFGAFPYLLDPRRARPPIISCGISALFFLTSRDRPPVGAPESSHPKNYLPQHLEFHAALQPASDYLVQVLEEMDVPPPSNFLLDAAVTLPDRYLQLTGSSFEYPCSDLPENVLFTGPIDPPSMRDFPEPAWWDKLDSGKPVILVTQGTVANQDFSELIEPAMQSLASDEVVVIVALGRPITEPLSVPVPENTFVVPFIPFDKLMPKVDVFLTNGGYGAINQALRNGVPIVVAGTSEDKSFIAARVAWSGCGIDLQTERPSPAQLRSAVHSILADESFKAAALGMADNFSRYNTLDLITAEIEKQIQAARDSAEVEPALA